MKKKIVSVIMTICMFATLAMGCGDTNTGSQTGVTGTEAEGQTAQNVAGDRADLILGATTGFFGSCRFMESVKIYTVWMKILFHSLGSRKTWRHRMKIHGYLRSVTG